MALWWPQAVIAQSKWPACSADAAPMRWHQCTGTRTFPTGTQYVGEFKDGKPHGQGVLVWPDGTRYSGDFRNGMRNGKGASTRPDGRQYVGEYREDKPHGVGTLIWADGRKHAGEFRDGRPQGLGVRYRPDGGVDKAGRWDGDSLVEAMAPQGPRWVALGITALTPPGAKQAAAPAGPKDSKDSPSTELRDKSPQAELETERRRRLELEQQLAALQAAERDRTQVKPKTVPGSQTQRSERRVALIVGNAAYRGSPLDNPLNDAVDVEASLRRHGFQTTLLRNANLMQMREATRRFAAQLSAADVALIYFAGHGIESKGKNYMIPIGADLQFEYELPDQAYDAGNWLEMLEGARSSNADRVNIVILDACRNNNLLGSRGTGRGLGRLDAPSGTFLAYSTAPGRVASDGPRGQRNSPFTRHLLAAMDRPNWPIEEVFKEVRRNVSRETQGAQVPWESTSLTGFFSFKRDK